MPHPLSCNRRPGLAAVTRKEGPAARPPTSRFFMSLAHLGKHLELVRGVAGAGAAGAGAAPAAAADPANPSASPDGSAPSLSSTAAGKSASQASSAPLPSTDGKKASQASSAPLPSTDAAGKDVGVVEGDQKKFAGRRWVARSVYGDGGYTSSVHGVLQ